MASTPVQPKITVTPMICVSYQASPYTNTYHFVGKTEEEARAKLQEFLDRPSKSGVVETPEGEVPVASGRGSGLVGKVWMIHHAKKLRERVDASDVDTYLGKGYEKGGPRTQFRD